MGFWRNSLLDHLRDRGTFEASDAITRIAADLNDPDIRWLLYEARRAARRKTWRPPAPKAILELLDEEKKRFVRSGDELLGVIVESLDRLEAKLQGETPAAVDVWSKVKDLVYRPMDESAISDYVKRHLQEDLAERGVVVARKVQIRRGEGSAAGERTDIHVSAVSPDSAWDVRDDVVRAIVEVKCSWNPSLTTAMDSQLVGRYLKDNHCSHGIYLVGWFQCPQWDPSDGRFKRSCTMDLEETKAHLASRASTLSVRNTKVRTSVLNMALR